MPEKYMETSSTITIRENNDLTNALLVLRQPTNIHTHARMHASHEVPWSEHGWDRICKEIYLIFKLSILFWFSSMRISRTLSRIDSLVFFPLFDVNILCRKERNAWKSVKWIFGVDVCFFHSFSRQNRIKCSTW